MTILLRNAVLVDGNGGPAVPNAWVLVEGNAIAAVGSGKSPQVAADAQAVDLKGKWLLPGMIDLHMHMYSMDDRPPEKRKLEPEAYGTLISLAHLRKLQMAGVTTVRDMATQRSINISVSRGIKEGLVQGPRVFACGQFICQTGGHGSSTPFAAREVCGVDDIRNAVREQWKAGATWIKVTLNGYRDVPELTQDELEALVDESHRLGLKVGAHASLLATARSAVAAGVDTIEHGCHLDEAVVAEMARKGIPLIPTGWVYVFLVNQRLANGLGEESTLILRKRSVNHAPGVKMALKAGVLIGAGTDCGQFFLPEELLWMEQSGMPRMHVIQSATKFGAQILGWGDKLGTIEKGKLADLIVVDADPLADVLNLRQVSMVIQDGKVVKSA